MPGGDRRGPMGMGAMAGRAAGYCTGFGAPGFTHAAPGRGFRLGFGRGRGFGGGGRGWRNMFHATGLPGWRRVGFYDTPYPYPATQQPSDSEWEKQSLRSQAEYLKSELDAVNKRLAEVDTESVGD